MSTDLFRQDAYLRSCTASVVGINDRGGIVVDQTVFYPTGGGQPGDTGHLTVSSGGTIPIAATVTDKETGQIVHVPAEDGPVPDVGESVSCEIDWTRRFAHMRTHTALHLLCSLIPFPVTGGQIGAAKGRLDFDIPEASLDKEDLTNRINQLVRNDLAVAASWITDAELAANPDLVRTMSVNPPVGSGTVRMITIADCDFQPCGGTHVRSTLEIGSIAVTKIEKKGARNRRVRIELTDEVKT